MSDDTQSYDAEQYNRAIQECIGAEMTIAERLERLIKIKCWSEGELSRRSGVPQPTINRIISGESESPRRTTITKIARALGVTPEWLLFGGGHESNVLPVVQPDREKRKYPLIDWSAARARTESGEGLQTDGTEEFIGSSEDAGALGYWLEVRGRSMISPTDGHGFAPGMRILIQPEGFEVVSGKLYIARLPDGDFTFRRYIKDAGEYLEPLNPAFETIKMDEGIAIVGRVIDAKLPPSVF